jgi:phenylalanyl-tRNA synthetase alpha subunit
MVLKNILRGTLHLYTGGVHVIFQNIWKKQRSKEVITRLKGLCKVKEEKKFEARLKELEKTLNDDAKAWLFEQLPEKSKWVLAFDEGSVDAEMHH